MSRERFSSPVWLLQGLFKSTPGTLELAQGRLRLLSEGGIVFDLPLDSLPKPDFPWYYFGAGVVISLESERYRLSFAEPGENGSIAEGREAGRRWKKHFLKQE
jgi:hypothetical protein